MTRPMSGDAQPERIAVKRRAALLEIFASVRSELTGRGLLTAAAIFHKLAASPAAAFDFAIVDESQDVSVAQLRFLAAMAAGRKNALFFAGDTGQRIFQPPFSWKSLGVDVRGRASTLRINYRTSHQIRGLSSTKERFTVAFARERSGTCPAEEFFTALSTPEQAKLMTLFKMIGDHRRLPPMKLSGLGAFSTRTGRARKSELYGK